MKFLYNVAYLINPLRAGLFQNITFALPHFFNIDVFFNISFADDEISRQILFCTSVPKDELSRI